MRNGLRQLGASLGSLRGVFRNRDLGRLIGGWAGMTFTTWAFAIALGVYAFGEDGATAVGIAALVRLLPGALASPFAGLLGDRHSRRLVLVLSALGAGAAIGLAALAAAVGAPAWVVYASAGLFTVASSPYVPAEGALLPRVARSPQELSAANVSHSQFDNLAFLAASLATGALLAVAGPQAAFALAALAGVATAALLATIGRDARPRHQAGADSAGGVLRESAVGLRELLADPRMRLVATVLVMLFLVEGAADVMVVIVALDLLGLGEGSVGWLTAAWGAGALVAGAGLAVLLDRGRLASGLAAGCLVAGAAFALPGALPLVAIAYLSYFLVGFGYTLVEVAGRTMMQRLGADESLARVIGFLETSRLTATAAGAIAAPVLVALLGIQGSLVAVGALLPALALLRRPALRALEIGGPVCERRYALLRESSIFSPLPVAALEHTCHSLVEVEARRGQDVIAQGEAGDRFYLIAEGELEVLVDGVPRGTRSAGHGFGEAALVLDAPRMATVRATRETRLLAMEREHFLETVNGHDRCRRSAEAVAEGWLGYG